MSSSFLAKEDYEEPCCPLKMTDTPNPIPTSRILEKLDEFLSRKDNTSAVNLLKYWLTEAKQNNDIRGQLTVLNEQIGIYRKTEKREECLGAINNVVKISSLPDFANTVTLGTTYINVATGYKAFNFTKEALPFYEKARKIYEKNLKQNDERLGALYNNMALTLSELKKYDDAEKMFYKAIDIMSSIKGKEPETAITYVNLADLTVARFGLENSETKIRDYLDKAEVLLLKDGIPKNADYAYVCEKCAGVFGYYGYFLTEKELLKRSREIYERS